MASASRVLFRHLTKGFPGAADRRGSAAVEMAAVCPAFVVTVMFFTQICLLLFTQQAMDYATSEAARQVQVGSAQGVPDSYSFVSGQLCPEVAYILSCSRLVATVAPVSNYDGSLSAFPPASIDSSQSPTRTNFAFCNASTRQMMLIRTAYLLPSILPSIFPNSVSFNGERAIAVTSVAAFMTEPFMANDAGPNGC